MRIALPRQLSYARLRQLAAGGAASIAVSVAATNVLRIVSSMTLTRLLDAHAYGVVGVITSIAYMLTMLSDVGLYAFIVRHADGDDPRFLDQVWTIRLIRAAFLMLLMLVVSRPAAGFLGKPELAPVVAVWSISFLFDGLASLAFATSVRRQRLWRLSMMELSANVVTFLCSVILALVLRSYWALVVAMLCGAATKTSLSYLLFTDSRRRFTFDRARSRELWKFSRFIALSSMLSLLILQSDKVVLARLMPLTAYGLYAIATTLAIAPEAIAIPYCTRVLYAIYSKTARTDRPALRHVLYRTRRKVVLPYMFLVSAMIGAAPLMIALLYDPRYRNVAPYLQLLAITVVLRMPSLAANQALIAIGRTRSTLIANVFRVTWLAAGGALALANGNIMVLVAVVGTVEVPGILCFWFNLRRARLLDVRQESYGLAAAALGLVVGYAVSTAAFALAPWLR